MASHTTSLSIISLLFISGLNTQPPQPQTGQGCLFTTCSEPAQVRRNAVYNTQGAFIGGCNCGCHWELYDPSSPTFCASPNVVHFNPYTLIGDCSCGARAPTDPPIPSAQTGSQPIPMPAPATPNMPTLPNFQDTMTPIAPILPVHPGLPNLPTFTPPGAVPAPQPGKPVTFPPVGPGTPIEVRCEVKGPCACPVNHKGRCDIFCDGETDACKDTIIECNNDGYPCTVNCMNMNACSGAASVMGPARSSLTVNCLGEKSCEGSTQFNGEAGSDLTVICDGITSCKGVQFNFGSAVSKVECNGEPDSCIGAVFNLLPNARTTPGAAYSCVGAFCPEVGVFAPEPFSNIVGAVGGCNVVGDCRCTDLTAPCDMTCDGSPDSCKDGVITCVDNHACVVNCMSEQACSGSAHIIGPKDAPLTVNCIGMKSCEGSAVISAAESTDVTVLFEGREAGKGSVEVNLGYGVASVHCNGTPDACEGVVINLLPDIETVPGAAFSCTGERCPLDAPLPFNNAGSRPHPNVPIVIQPAPLNPGGVSPPAPVVPAPAPIAPQPAVPAPPPQSTYCCVTSIPKFKPWAGRCWDESIESACSAEPNGRCVWDPLNCNASPPVNSLVSTPCKFFDNLCAHDSDCCSETCNPNGLCR